MTDKPTDVALEMRLLSETVKELARAVSELLTQVKALEEATSQPSPDPGVGDSTTWTPAPIFSEV